MAIVAVLEVQLFSWSDDEWLDEVPGLKRGVLDVRKQAVGGV